MELRLTTFAGNAELKKINYHVVFSTELSADDIDQFFLRSLNVALRLDEGVEWRGCLGNRAGLEDLGEKVRASIPINKRGPGKSSLRAGFASAAVPIEKVREVLAQSVFKDKTLTAIGLAEWNMMRWEGAGLAQKRDIMVQSNFVFTAAPNLAKYAEQRSRLEIDGFGGKLIDASDAHFYANESSRNRLGACNTWIKADLTFQGLRRAIDCFKERVFVGDVPPKVERVRNNRRKYIRSITIRRNDGSKLAEKWFDASLELNHDLVAIIGNQGSGKSALTDIIALCGASKTKGFSFLNVRRFRDRDGRAKHFAARLTWEDDTSVAVSLDADGDPDAVERVRYVPQEFFHDVTNENEVTPDGSFYGEITKAIFSHIPMADRIGAASFSDLVENRTAAIDVQCAALCDQMAALNRQIVGLEESSSASAIAKLESALSERRLKVESLRASPPQEVSPPTAATAETAEVERLRAAELELREQKARKEVEHGEVRKRQAAIERAMTSLGTAERQARGALAKIEQDLASAGVELNISAAFRVALDTSVLSARLEAEGATLGKIQGSLDREREDGIAGKLARISAQREQQERALEAADAAYQAYLTRRAQWEDQLRSLEGDAEAPAPESAKGLRRRLEQMRVDVPQRLAELREQRRALCKEIFEARASLASVYAGLTEPVRTHIASNPLIRERYQLTFDVVLNESGLADRLFGCVGQSTGTFAGVQLGQDRLRKLIEVANFRTADDALSFAETLLDNLSRNHRHDPPSLIELRALLKKGVELTEVYDLIFSLEYVKPAFALALGGKPMRRLSPGERGILLLVFYLVVDCGDEPLIIDQPEGNLNNQSIVDNLVPVFMAAKARRQILLVTHNPNLAVVCDAEQVIHCQIDQEDGNAVMYRAGALENPMFNQLSLDLLEGTARAFTVRKHTYEQSSGRL